MNYEFVKQGKRGDIMNRARAMKRVKELLHDEQGIVFHEIKIKDTEKKVKETYTLDVLVVIYRMIKL